MSRRVSPKKLKPITARLMAKPGKIASQGACSINARPVLLNIKPHDGVGGWVPSPGNLNEASIEDSSPQPDRSDDENRRGDVGQDMAGDNAQMAAAKRLRHLNGCTSAGTP
jgi:hypothetical protein